jgi:hypothetical protein
MLSLIDIDRPSFQDLTRDRLQGLQRLVSTASKLLWITAGPESDCPYLDMSKGWLRSLAYERRGTLLQYPNIENAAAINAELLANSLMRLVYADSGNDHTMPTVVYTTEHELYYRDGTMQICRLRNEDTLNQRYLSARRWVSTQVEPTDPRTAACVVPDTAG